MGRQLRSRSLAVAAAAFLAGIGLMAATGIGVNLWTRGSPVGYTMPRALQWVILGAILLALVAVEAASARRRLWLALPLTPVLAYLGLVLGILGSVFWPVDLLMLALAVAGLRALRRLLFPGSARRD